MMIIPVVLTQRERREERTSLLLFLQPQTQMDLVSYYVEKSEKWGYKMKDTFKYGPEYMIWKKDGELTNACTILMNLLECGQIIRDEICMGDTKTFSLRKIDDRRLELKITKVDGCRIFRLYVIYNGSYVTLP